MCPRPNRRVHMAGNTQQGTRHTAPRKLHRDRTEMGQFIVFSTRLMPSAASVAPENWRRETEVRADALDCFERPRPSDS